MPGARKSSHLSANARVRRAAHLERAKLARQRKRDRSRRAAIHAAMEAAARLVEVSSRGPFTAGGRGESGWELLDREGVTRGSYSSRDKLRDAVRTRNADGPMDRDAAMLALGWRKLSGRPGRAVDAKFERVGE